MVDKNASVALATEGLREALNSLDHLAKLDAQRTLRAEFKALATTAEQYARAGARTRLQQKAAKTLRASASATASSLRYGAGFAGAMGAEFGAGRNEHRLPRHQMSAARRRHSSHGKGWMLGWNQFLNWKGNDAQAGYFVWPGIRRAVEEMMPKMAEAIGKVFTTGKDT